MRITDLDPPLLKLAYVASPSAAKRWDDVADSKQTDAFLGNPESASAASFDASSTEAPKREDC